jgi:hypothetical protein
VTFDRRAELGIRNQLAVMVDVNDEGEGEFETVLPPGSYRFRIDGKESDVVLEIREGDVEVRLDFDAEGKGMVVGR